MTAILKISQKSTQNKIYLIYIKMNLGKAWLETVQLPEVDRLEMDLLLQEWNSLGEHIKLVNQKITERANRSVPGHIMNSAQILMTAPGVSHYTGLGIASRIGSIKRFPCPRSLANYFGLTPGCRNSGNNKHRPGSITKEGSRFVRFVLGQLVLHFLKHDAKMRDWYRRIKLHRGAKIARVAVMRRATTIFWHMLTYEEAYYMGGPPPRLRQAHEHHQSKKGAA